MQHARAGFTVVEVITVVVIIALLSTISAAVYISSQNDARDSRIKATADIVTSGLERYYKDNGEYPTPREAASGKGAATGYDPTQTTVVESNFTAAAQLLRTSTSSLYGSDIRFTPCISGTGTTTCTPLIANTTWVYYISRSNQSATSTYTRTMSPCTVTIAGSGGTGTGASGYVVAYYSVADSSWKFKRSLQGTVSISGTGCAFTG